MVICRDSLFVQLFSTYLRQLFNTEFFYLVFYWVSFHLSVSINVFRQIDVKLSVQYMSFSAHADAKGIMQLIRQVRLTSFPVFDIVLFAQKISAGNSTTDVLRHKKIVNKEAIQETKHIFILEITVIMFLS